MKITLRVFSYLSEILDFNEKELEVGHEMTVGDLWNRYRQDMHDVKNLRVLFAVNHEYAKEDYLLKDGDEVAFIPPISGG